jgi:hypothetical protein
MLLAYGKGKTRTAPAIKLIEDEVTSIVFGPLVFMHTADVWHVIKECQLADVDDIRQPIRHQMDFWRSFENPQLCTPMTWIRAEPDIVVRFEFPHEK